MDSEIESLPLDELYKVKIDDERWKPYLKYKEFLESHYKNEEQYLEKEILTYNQIIENIADILKALKLNEIQVCLLLTNLLYRYGGLYYDDYKSFTYRDKAIEEAQNVKDKAKLSVIEIKRYLGSLVILGYGCCRHTAKFFKDVFDRCDFKAYDVQCSFYDVNINYQNEIYSKYSLSDEVYIEQNSENDINHAALLFLYEGHYYLYDFINLRIADVSGYHAYSLYDDGKYGILYPYLIKSNNFSLNDLYDFYKIIFKQELINNDIKKELLGNIKNYMGDTSKQFDYIKKNFSDKIEDIYKLEKEYENHFNNRDAYKEAYQRQLILQSVLK